MVLGLFVNNIRYIIQNYTLLESNLEIHIQKSYYVLELINSTSAILALGHKYYCGQELVYKSFTIVHFIIVKKLRKAQ